jgi:hypothetical protein
MNKLLEQLKVFEEGKAAIDAEFGDTEQVINMI